MAVRVTTPVCEDRWDLPDVLLVPMASLDDYFARIRAQPILSAEEEAQLGRAVQAGDRGAAIRLALANLRYAAHLARKWERPASVEMVWGLGDAVQAANLGLWTAAQRYNPAFARFTTYATWWIRQAWYRARNDFLWQVRLPSHALPEWHAYQQAEAAWSRSHATPPTAADLIALLGWPASRIAFWQQWATTESHPASLDVRVGESDTTPLGDLIPDPGPDGIWQRLDQLARQEAVDALLNTLSPRDADVLRLRFGLSGSPMTLQEIGDVLRVTRERIRQIESRALKALRTWADRHPEFSWQDLIHDQ